MTDYNYSGTTTTDNKVLLVINLRTIGGTSFSQGVNSATPVGHVGPERTVLSEPALRRRGGRTKDVALIANDRIGSAEDASDGAIATASAIGALRSPRCCCSRTARRTRRSSRWSTASRSPRSTSRSAPADPAVDAEGARAPGSARRADRRQAQGAARQALHRRGSQARDRKRLRDIARRAGMTPDQFSKMIAQGGISVRR